MFWVTAGIFFSIATQLVLGESSPSPTASSAVPTHTVNVGAGGLVFTPKSITANISDIIEFRFYPQNHSVARSDYKSPCIPYEDTGAGRKGFWSGFRPLSVVLNDPPIFQVIVNDTSPIFFYCSAPGACIDDGMIGVINPNQTETLEVQQEYAKNATLMFSPGEYFPAEVAPTSSSPTSSSSTSSSATSSTSSATSSPTSPPSGVTSSTSSSSKPSTGAIVGIAIGASAVLTIAAVLLYLCGRQRTIGEIMQQHQAPRPPPIFLPGPRRPSIDSSTPKMSRMEASPLSSPNPYSPVARSAAEMESFRSHSQLFDETRESMIAPLSFNNLPGHQSPTGRGSPVIRRPVPQSPGMMDRIPSSSHFTPMAPPYQDELLHEPLASEIPSALRVSRISPHQRGPHELSGESDPNNLQYQHPDFQRNERIGLGG